MAGRIPKAFIDDILDKTDIVELIERRIPLKKAGRNYQACCPFHNEKTPSFSISPEKQFYYCFGCGATGNSITFIMEYDGLEFVEAIEDLAQNLGIEVPRELAPSAESKWEHNLYDLMGKAARYYQHQLRQPKHQKAIDYLKKRGLSGEIARDYGLGYAPAEWHNLRNIFAVEASINKALVDCGLYNDKDGKNYDRFRDRVTFPIRDKRGRVIAFGGRIIDQGEPKYLNSPETDIFHKGQELYGLYEMRQAQRKITWVLVVEGYMDVVALAQFGLRNAVATLGTATTSAHVQQLFRVCSKIVFCFDGDRAGREAALRALNHSLPHIKDNREIRFMFLPDGEDPDTQVRQIGAEEFAQQAQTAPTLFDFLHHHLKSQVDLNTFEGPGQLANLARSFVKLIEDPIHKERFIANLSQDVGLSETKLNQLLDDKPAAKAPSKSPQLRQQSQLTPIRRAITLLLNTPTLAENIVDFDWLQDLTVAGSNILYEMLEILSQSPHMSTGRLIEHWRDTQYEHHLQRLAIEEVLIPEEGMLQELIDIMSRLKREGLEQRRDQLLYKSQNGHLSQNEKDELLILLQKLK